MKQLKFGIILSYVGLFLNNITSLLFVPFMLKSLGPADYGLYVLIGSIVAYISLLDFGFANALTRYIVKCRIEKDKSKETNIVSTFLITYLLLSCLVVLVGGVLYANLDSIFSNSIQNKQMETAKFIFMLTIFNAAITLPLNAFSGIIAGYERFVFAKTSAIARSLLRVLFITILLLLGYKVIAIVVVDTIINVCWGIASIVYCYRVLDVRIRYVEVKFALVKEFITYSMFVFISMVADLINQRVGQVILGISKSTQHVAVYSISMSLVSIFTQFPSAINNMFIPRITKKSATQLNGEELTGEFIRVSRIQFIIIAFLFSGFLLYGNDFVQLWAGKEYSQSWLLAIIILAPLSVDLLQNLGVQILYARNMHSFRGYALLGSAMLNIAISYLLVESYGLIGVAAGTAFSYLLGNVILTNIYYHYRVGINVIRYFKEVMSRLIWIVCLVLILTSPTLMIVSESWPVLIIKAIIFTVIYSILMWFCGFNSYEKSLILNVAGPIFKWRNNRHR